MTDPMTDQEKNEVLAKFAGFYPKVFTASSDEPTETLWSDPLDREWLMPKLPDLLHSLDALKQWIWPEVVRRFSAKKLHIILDLWVHDALEKGELPKAEACAEAILSLVGDGQEETT